MLVRSETVLPATVVKRSNDLLYSEFSIPRPGVSSQWFDRELFKTRTVQGSSDISAQCATDAPYEQEATHSSL